MKHRCLVGLCLMYQEEAKSSISFDRSSDLFRKLQLPGIVPAHEYENSDAPTSPDTL
jgi:hypothetical protein